MLEICRTCDASFACEDWGALHRALVAHKRTCAENWEGAIKRTKRKEKTVFRCPLCRVEISHHQAPLFLLAVVEGHLAVHAPAKAPHRCQLCRGACEG